MIVVVHACAIIVQALVYMCVHACVHACVSMYSCIQHAGVFMRACVRTCMHACLNVSELWFMYQCMRLERS